MNQELSYNEIMLIVLTIISIGIAASVWIFSDSIIIRSGFV